MHRYAWKALTATGIVWLGVLTYDAATTTSQQQVDQARRNYAILQVARGNIVRAYVRQDASRNAAAPKARRALADKLFPILDAERTVDENRNVPLPPEEQQAYINSISRGVVP